jgi:hypothetical protein
VSRRYKELKKVNTKRIKWINGKRN